MLAPGSSGRRSIDASTTIANRIELRAARHHLLPNLPSPPSVLRQDGTMLRQTLVRSAWRTGRQQAAVAGRAFSATAQRPAEVELTIGEHPPPLAAIDVPHHADYL